MAYDRTALIDRAVDTLTEKLLEESLVVAVVCIIFLLHFRSALVAIITLPVAILISFIVMNQQGINANIMSLGGIAIAIGAMVDAAIIMIENAHKHLERDAGKKPHWRIIADAATEVGPALFYSLLVITVSFVPVFTLQAQEGRLFKPLAFTKTYAMAAAALLSITLVPVLMGYFIRGRILPEHKNPLNRFLIWIYHPVLEAVMRFKWPVLALAILVMAATVIPYSQLGSEFMPPLWEGDLLYMPTTLPGISITKARELLQQTDKIIKSFPEVQHVFGKIGRAENRYRSGAAFTMIETTIMLRAGKRVAAGNDAVDKLTDELNAAIQVPGLTNAWTMPIKTRIDMPLDRHQDASRHQDRPARTSAVLEDLGRQVEAVAPRSSRHPKRSTPNASWAATTSTSTSTVEAIARYGLTVGDVQDVIQTGHRRHEYHHHR